MIYKIIFLSATLLDEIHMQYLKYYFYLEISPVMFGKTTSYWSFLLNHMKITSCKRNKDVEDVILFLIKMLRTGNEIS